MQVQIWAAKIHLIESYYMLDPILQRYHDTLEFRDYKVLWKNNVSDTVKKCLFFSGSSLVKITIMKDRLYKLYAPLTMKREVVGIQ